MKKIIKTSILVCLSIAASPVISATVRVPMCLQFPDDNRVVPCTGVVPIDSTTGNPLSWQALFASGGNGSSSSAGPSAATTVGQPAGTYVSQTGYVGADGNAHSWVGDNTGHPAVSIFGTVVTSLSGSLPSGTNTIGAISNSSFGVSSLPALPAGTNTIGSIANTSFASTQSGAWNVGISGSVAVTGTFYQATQPVSVAGTLSVNNAQVNGVALQTGTGVSGTGTQRVAVASDSSIAVSNFPSSQTVNGTVSVGNFPATQPVSIASTVATTSNITQVGGTALALGSTTQAASLPVALSTDGPVGLKTDAAATTTDATSTSLIAQVKQTNAKLGSPLQAGGTVVATANLAQVAGVTTAVGAGASNTGTQRVTVASDSSILVSNFPTLQAVDTVVKSVPVNRSAVIGFGGTANAATSASTSVVVNNTTNFTNQAAVLSGIPMLGQIVAGSGITAGTTITAVTVNSATQYALTLSAAATIPSGSAVTSVGPQVVIATNAARRGFSIQNQGSGICYINPTGVATIGPDSLSIQSSSYFESKESQTPTGAVSAICTTSATGVFGREW